MTLIVSVLLLLAFLMGALSWFLFGDLNGPTDPVGECLSDIEKQARAEKRVE